ncbi:MAG: glucose 1-dehydrogenase [Candidatus Latescibacterota bacterium]|nr:glucose 1-dehydrogenase [Candidatus Latescibacterota bacterium]
MSVVDRMNLKGKVAIVTGAGRGIGRGVAKAFAEAGSDLALVSRTQEQVEEAAEEARELGVKAVAITADVGNTDDIERIVSMTVQELGRVDVLVNNAGINFRAPTVEFPIEQFDKIIRVNLRGVWYLTQQAARQMISQGDGGRVINTTSLASHMGVPGLSAYAASKGGVGMIIKVMAVEWAEHGITVNGVSPGYIATPLTQPLRDDQERNDWIISRIPMRRWGTPEDMCGIYVFLASDAAGYITGQLCPVDGGWLAG